MNLDFSIMKRFFTFENQFLDVRAEMFNTTHTPNFATPSATIGNASTGRIFSLVNAARQIQFALRYEF